MYSLNREIWTWCRYTMKRVVKTEKFYLVSLCLFIHDISFFVVCRYVVLFHYLLMNVQYITGLLKKKHKSDLIHPTIDKVKKNYFVFHIKICFTPFD